MKGLEDLVQKGLYANRSEAIRVAVRDLLKRELYDAESGESNTKYIPEKATVTIRWGEAMERNDLWALLFLFNLQPP